MFKWIKERAAARERNYESWKRIWEANDRAAQADYQAERPAAFAQALEAINKTNPLVLASGIPAIESDLRERQRIDYHENRLFPYSTHPIFEFEESLYFARLKALALGKKIRGEQQ